MYKQCVLNESIKQERIFIMTMQVNSSSATDNIYGGCSDKPAADAERQEPVSIFSDKNRCILKDLILQNIYICNKM